MSQLDAAVPRSDGTWHWPERQGAPASPAWSAELERMRAAQLTALYAVEAAALMSQLHPADRWTYCEEHRADWDARAELPPTGYLVALAERIPGALVAGDATESEAAA